jgi:hypothetical protein
MGKDKSMSGWTPERLDEKAQEDARDKNYDPPHSWWPGRERPGTEARDRYDRAYDHHSKDDED